MADDAKTEAPAPSTGGGTQEKSKLRSNFGDVVFTNPFTGNDTNLSELALNLPGKIKSRLQQLWKNDTCMSDAIETVDVPGIGVCVETKHLLGSLYQALGKTFINYWWAKSATDLQTDNSRSVAGTAARKLAKGVKKLSDQADADIKNITANKEPVAESVDEYIVVEEADEQEQNQQQGKNEEETDKTDAMSDAEKDKQMKEIAKTFEKERKNFKADFRHKPNLKAVTVNGMDFDQYLKMVRACPINLLKKDGKNYIPSKVAKMSYEGDEGAPVKFLVIYACEKESLTKKRLESLEYAYGAIRNKDNKQTFPGADTIGADKIVGKDKSNETKTTNESNGGVLADFVLEAAKEKNEDGEITGDKLSKALKSVLDNKKNGPYNNLEDAEPALYETIEKAMGEGFDYVQFLLDDGNLEEFGQQTIEKKWKGSGTQTEEPKENPPKETVQEADENQTDDSKENKEDKQQTDPPAEKQEKANTEQSADSTEQNTDTADANGDNTPQEKNDSAETPENTDAQDGKEKEKKILEVSNLASDEGKRIIALYNQTGNIVCAICDTEKMMKDISGRLMRSGKNEHNNATVKSADDFKLGVIYTKIDAQGGPKMSSKQAREIEARKKEGQYAESNFGSKSAEAEKDLEGVWYNYDPKNESYEDQNGYRQFEHGGKGSIAANGKSTPFNWESDGKFVKFSVTKDNNTKVYCRKYTLENGILTFFGTIDGKEQPIETRISNKKIKNNELKRKIASFKGPWTVTNGTSYTFGVKDGDEIRIEEPKIAESLLVVEDNNDENNTDNPPTENADTNEKNRGDEGDEVEVTSDENGIEIDSVEQDDKSNEITINLKGHEAITITPDPDDPTKISEINGQKATNKPQEDKDKEKEAEEDKEIKEEFIKKLNGTKWYSEKEGLIYEFHEEYLTFQKKENEDKSGKPSDRKPFKSIKKDKDGAFVIEIEKDNKPWTIKLVGANDLEINGTHLSSYNKPVADSIDQGLFKGNPKGKKNKQGEWKAEDGERYVFKADSQGNVRLTVTDKNNKLQKAYFVKSTNNGKLTRVEADVGKDDKGNNTYSQKENAENQTVDYSIKNGSLNIDDKVLSESIELDIVEPVSSRRKMARQIVIESVGETTQRKHYLEVEEPCQ